jgi:hypothetical protein
MGDQSERRRRSTAASDRSGTESDRRSLLGGLRRRLVAPFSGLFSIRSFGVLLAAALAALVVVPMVLPGGPLAGFVGLALVGFLAALARPGRRYLELALAGAVAAGGATVLDHLVLTALGAGVPLVFLGVGGGAAAAVVGHYLGRDLRDGLTRAV